MATHDRDLHILYFKPPALTRRSKQRPTPTSSFAGGHSLHKAAAAVAGNALMGMNRRQIRRRCTITVHVEPCYMGLAETWVGFCFFLSS